jgi:response regulator RpfG family c-di-GMP phosphodiesterase
MIHILYIDDSRLDQELVIDALEKEFGGFTVTRTATRAEFERVLAQGGFDLVLSDFNILGFEGLQVLDAVHARDSGLPVIIVTGTGSEEIAVEAMKRGAADYVIKTPHHIQRLPQTIYAVLQKKQVEVDRDRLFIDLEHSHQELANAYEATLEGWSRALDLRDRETEGHTRRVTETTLELACRMGFSAEDLLNVRRGALLHDIGKLGVPDYVLLKPGPLNPEEWEIMRRHPTYAYEMLYPITYLRPAIDIPYCHHERWDGTGYPRGLVGEEIPLPARIFAIVDVWDALRSDRPYRKAWSQDRVIAYIQSIIGKYFDPGIAGLFLEIVAEPRKVSHR